MDRLIKENLESLLQETSNTKRLGRRIISLAGFLSPSEPPEHLQEQLSNLSRLLIQQDAFDALLEPVTLMSRAGLTHTLDAHAMRAMLGLEEAFDMEFPDHLLNRKSFASIDAIERTVGDVCVTG